ncbi:cysteine-rich CWC family protein [Leptospira ilyithenensis]|uniref:cysteine-rich CWC family protein n=1 Tax=Leptospira ilyithenensis TaxID=2484901 RepID=UPI001FE9872E|nr:cysteine-rich CWC family protein [Leptospira ilyithenensis]
MEDLTHRKLYQSATRHKEGSPKHEIKFCPRCLIKFECKVGSIALCQCSGFSLSTEEKDFISSQFDDCLCRECINLTISEYNTIKIYKSITWSF